MQKLQANGRFRLRGLGVVALVLTFMSVGFAQEGEDFSDDEFSDFDDFGDGDDFDDFDDFGDDDDFDDFGDFEDGDEFSDFDDFGDGDDFDDEGDFGLPTIAGLIVSSDALAPPLAEQLTQALDKELSELGIYEQVSNEAIHEEFEIMGEELAAECAFDPVCMGRIGRNAGIDMIVVGRVETTSTTGQWGTTLDLIDTGIGQIDNFVYFTTPAKTVSVQDSLRSQTYRLLRIREERSEGITKKKGRAQRAVGWTAVALGAAAIGTGAYFAVDFKNQQKDFNDLDRIPESRDPRTGLPVLDITQREGQDKIDEMNRSRNLSYALIGAGAGVALTGAILLAVSPGKDIYDEYDSRDRNARRRINIAPLFAPGGMGVQGGLEF